MQLTRIPLLLLILFLSACSAGISPLDGFDEDKESYAYHNNLWMARFAELAYENPKRFQKALDGFGLEEDSKLTLIENKKSDAQVYLLTNDDVIIVSFRGTESFKDALTDANALMNESRMGKIHQGFNEQYDSLRKKIHAHLKEHHDGQSIWVTGHSLGGALATLFAALIPQEYRSHVKGIYTYGQPMVGDEGFVKNLERTFPQSYLRMTNSDDQVPLVPGFDYQHGGIEIHYDDKGRPHCGRPKKSGWDQAMEGARVLGRLIQGDMGKHSIRYYLQYLNSPQTIRTQKRPEREVTQCKKIAGKLKA